MMHLNKVQRHHFLQPGGGGVLWDKLASRGSGNSIIFESHSQTFYYNLPEKDTKNGSEEIVGIKNKTGQNASGFAILLKFMSLNNFLRNLVFKKCDPYMVAQVRIRVNPKPHGSGPIYPHYFQRPITQKVLKCKKSAKNT